ncbi:MAG: 30S ribosomal protein S6 [Candidatus Azosocius agrarius]|nr:MAG: 30S ribosomal protein S6 [Gammaproteobacteria bacterium]
MKHYEIVFLVHPDRKNQLATMIQNYKKIIESDGGQIHRLEDWGKRQLAYLINKVHKANYSLMNIECTKDALNKLTTSFRFNDAIIRYLIIKVNEPITAMSSILNKEQDLKKLPKINKYENKN